VWFVKNAARQNIDARMSIWANPSNTNVQLRKGRSRLPDGTFACCEIDRLKVRLGKADLRERSNQHMIANASRPVLPRAKRKPSRRNMQIYEEVRVLGQRQDDVAQRHGVNQKRVSQICQQVDRWRAWVQTSPDREQMEAEQRRQTLLDVRKRNEKLLLAALRQAGRPSQRLVTERRVTEGGQTTIDRTERELPIDSGWLSVALKASNSVARISQTLGVDLEPSTLGPEVDELLAAMLADRQEGESRRVGEGETDGDPKEGAKSSRSSNDKAVRSPNRGNISGDEIAATNCDDTTCVEIDGAELAHKGAQEKANIPPAKLWCEPESKAAGRPSQASQIPQTATSKLPREVRERRAKFLQSGSEPEADKKRLVLLKPR